MGNFKAVTSFTQSADPTLLQFARNVYQAMRENRTFPNPTPNMELLNTAIEDFGRSIPDRANLNQNTAALKNGLRQTLLENLRQLALYVTAASNGDRQLILSSGFVPSKERQSTGQLDAPQNVRYKHGKISGTIHIICDRMENAYSYEVQTRLGGSQWQPGHISPRANILVTDLSPGFKYDFQIRAIGAAGPSDFVQIIGVIVL